MINYNDLYICKRLRLLKYLKDLGFMPILQIPDYNNPAFNVWGFAKTQELDEALKKYFDQFK